MADSQALVVLMTGRRAHLREPVFAVLRAHAAARFHASYFNDGSLETLAYKSRALRALVHSHAASLEAVHVYEDREEHAAAFEELGREPFRPAACLWRVHLVVDDGGGEAVAHWPQPPAASLMDALPDSPPQAPSARPSLSPSPSPASAAAAAAASAAGCWIESSHYVRLCLAASPFEAAAVPAAWRESKRARDGDAPPAHITLITAAELRGLEPEQRLLLSRLLRRVRPQLPRSLGLGCCVGLEGAEAGVGAAFLCVDVPAGGWLRRQLGLGRLNFHVTLGFEGIDPHEGVSKGPGAVLPPPKGGWGQGELALARMGVALRERVAVLKKRVGKGGAL